MAGYVILFALGSVLQSQAMKGKELGPIYILVPGLEAVLAFGVGAMFDEAATRRKLIAVILIVLGIALLKID